MPNPPTTYMLLVLPTENADADLWDQLLNAALGGDNGIDAHDHTPGRGKLIPSAAININAALVFNNQRGTQIRGLAFTPLGAPLATGIFELHVGPDNNLYYRNATGVNVRVTNGNTLDVTSVGGIAGDYSAVGAEVAYVDASDTYTMRQQVALLVRQWARVACGGLDLLEYKAAGDPIGVSNRVRLSSPAALASSYELVMPPALPVAGSLLQLGPPSGAAANVVASNILPANQDIVISGTGIYKHGLKTKIIPVTAPGLNPAGLFTNRSASTTGAGSGAQHLIVPLGLDVGQRILNLRVVVVDNITGPTPIRAKIVVQNGAAGFTDVPGSLTPLSDGSGTEQTLAATGINVACAANREYFIQCFSSGSDCRVWRAELDYDQP